MCCFIKDDLSRRKTIFLSKDGFLMLGIETKKRAAMINLKQQLMFPRSGLCVGRKRHADNFPVAGNIGSGTLGKIYKTA